MAIVQSYRRSKLRRLCRMHADAEGWNSHPMVIERRVDLWLAEGTGATQLAIEHYQANRSHRIWSRVRVAIALLVLGVAGTFVAIWLR